jgi:hypothetical protein
MKNYFSKLIRSKNLAENFTISCLKLVYITLSLLLLYYIFLDSTSGVKYTETLLLREALVYIGTSVGLSVAFGLLIDLYIKKSGK